MTDNSWLANIEAAQQQQRDNFIKDLKGTGQSISGRKDLGMRGLSTLGTVARETSPPQGHVSAPTLQIHITHLPTKGKLSLNGWVNQFSDQFQSTWSGTPVYGRMDDLYTFQRTGRKISIQFDVLAADQSEAASNQDKLNRLAQFLYPVYTPQSVGSGKNAKSFGRNQRVLVSPPLLKMRWANLIENNQELGGLTGFLNGFSYTPTIEAGQFFGPFTSGEVLNYQQYSVQLEFTVLHTHLTGWSRATDGTYVFGGDEEQAAVLRDFPHRALPPGSFPDPGGSSRALSAVQPEDEVGNQEAASQQDAVTKG